MKKIFVSLLFICFLFEVTYAKKTYDEVMQDEKSYNIEQVSTWTYQHLLMTDKSVKKYRSTYEGSTGCSCCDESISWGHGRMFYITIDNKYFISPTAHSICFVDLSDNKEIVKSMEVNIGSDLGTISAVYQANDGRLIFNTAKGMYYTTEENPKRYVKFNDNVGTIIGEHGGYIYYMDFRTLWRTDMKSYESETVVSDIHGFSMQYPYVYCSKGNDEGRGEIFRYNIETEKRELLLSNAGHGYCYPMVSPNGRWLLMTGNALSPISGQQNVDIFLYDFKTQKLHQLTTHPGHDWHPAWGKDGKMVYFLSNRSNALYTDTVSVPYRMDVSSIVNK